MKYTLVHSWRQRLESAHDRAVVNTYSVSVTGRRGWKPGLWDEALRGFLPSQQQRCGELSLHLSPSYRFIGLGRMLF